MSQVMPEPVTCDVHALRVDPPGPASNVDPTDEFLAIYMAKPFWSKVYYSMVATFFHGVWAAIMSAHGPRETKDKLKTYWTTVGVVSALLLGVSYQNGLQAVKSDDEDLHWAVGFTTVAGGLALLDSLFIITFTVIYIVEIDNCATDADLDAFIKNNSKIFDILTGLFGISVLLLLITALGNMYINYPFPQFMVVCSIICFLAVLASVYVAFLLGINRLKLYARFESKEAVAYLQLANRESSTLKQVTRL